MHVLYNLCPFFLRKVCWTTISTWKRMEGGGVRLWSSEDDISKNHWNWKSTAIFLKKKSDALCQICEIICDWYASLCHAVKVHLKNCPLHNRLGEGHSSNRQSLWHRGENDPSQNWASVGVSAAGRIVNLWWWHICCNCNRYNKHHTYYIINNPTRMSMKMWKDSRLLHISPLSTWDFFNVLIWKIIF